MEIKKLNNKTIPEACYDYQIKNNDIGGTCSTHGKERNTAIMWQNLKGRKAE
jgi:fatty acid-binding protein DegV